MHQEMHHAISLRCRATNLVDLMQAMGMDLRMKQNRKQ
jgi:hypothetical protein